MAVKKTQLYASLWASCDKLRGGMDSSEYKDYILTLLFMKYVTDKFKNKGASEDLALLSLPMEVDSYGYIRYRECCILRGRNE